ncbi:Ribose 1,5-bisphosphate phosphokinase PhnN [Candidatus Tiddalikarchaeum anstoanum]|nr:Ribose 1,5-bisphosphate phosphokinase PhnN [Candidatus Tiddalikarchaeum anstoanum]
MKGLLFLVVGNSGSGKDAIIEWACNRNPNVTHVKRFITRPSSVETEDFVSVKKEDFKKSDYFLWWESYDKLYGIGKDVIEGLKKGRNYIVNISRDALGDAKTKWPSSVTVEITAPISLIEERLSKRGREAEPEVQRRIERAKTAPNVNPDIVIDGSNSDVSIAGKALLNFIAKKAK